jgi:hypothetical protein
MGKEWCSYTSIMGAKLLKEDQLNSCSHGHTDREKISYSISETKSRSTSETGSTADTRDAHANCFTTAANARDAHTDCPNTAVNNNASCLNPN